MKVQGKMTKKSFGTLIAIYVFFFILNYISPMAFGDDYLYSFIWQGKPMYQPLSEDAIRIASWHDLLVSQWSHYLTWSGRTVNHTIAQFFLWMGKDVFNIFNALISVILVLEIYFAIHKGELKITIQAKEVCMIFFALWAFTPGFVTVFCWLDGACNYLWTNTLILGFTIPYIYKYYHLNKKTHHKHLFGLIMFLLGILAGWTNENSVCWLILFLLLFILKYRKCAEIETWNYSGLIGLVTGYCLLMFAPGNAARLFAEHGGANWFNMPLLKANAEMLFAVIFMYQIFLWYFNLRSLITLKQMKIKNYNLEKEIIFAKIFCVCSLCMTGIMLFSPFFPPRSALAGTVFLIIATGVIANIQRQHNIAFLQESAKKFLSYLVFVYFIMTTTVTLYCSWSIYGEMQDLIAKTKQVKSREEILIVKPFNETTKLESLLSGFHIPGFELSKDENNWSNVAFARYYGIKGIRMVRDKNETDQEKAKTISESTPSVHQSR